MKKLIYSTMVSLLVTVAAQAADIAPDRNDASGATPNVTGIDCDMCAKYTAGGTLVKASQKPRSYDELLPGDSSGGAAGATGGAQGTK